MCCLQNSCNSQPTEGKSPVFISGRSAQERCPNQFVWLHASPPACKTTAERVIWSIIPLQRSARWARPQGCQFMLVNSLACSFPPRKKPQFHQTARMKSWFLKKTSVSSLEALCKHFQQRFQRYSSLRCTATQLSKDYQILMWYYHIIKSIRWRQRCEERSLGALGALQRCHRYEGKRESCKEWGMPKKHSNMIGCVLRGN